MPTRVVEHFCSTAIMKDETSFGDIIDFQHIFGKSTRRKKIYFRQIDFFSLISKKVIF